MRLYREKLTSEYPRIAAKIEPLSVELTKLFGQVIQLPTAIIDVAEAQVVGGKPSGGVLEILASKTRNAAHVSFQDEGAIDDGYRELDKELLEGQEPYLSVNS